MPPLGESNGHDPMPSRDPERWLVTPIRLEPNISKTAGDAIWQKSLICCEPQYMQSTILATAWLLVETGTS